MDLITQTFVIISIAVTAVLFIIAASINVANKGTKKPRLPEQKKI